MVKYAFCINKFVNILQRDGVPSELISLQCKEWARECNGEEIEFSGDNDLVGIAKNGACILKKWCVEHYVFEEYNYEWVFKGVKIKEGEF